MERILLKNWMQCIAIRELLLKKLKRRKQKIGIKFEIRYKTNIFIIITLVSALLFSRIETHQT